MFEAYTFGIHLFKLTCPDTTRVMDGFTPGHKQTTHIIGHGIQVNY